MLKAIERIFPPSMNRRDALRAGAAWSASVCCGIAASGNEHQQQSVADSASDIKVSRITPVTFRDRVFIRLDTNFGISGWGEIKGVVPSVANALVKAMFALIKDQNPTRIEHIWQTLYRAERNQRGGAFMLHCIAGIDMALWDIAGKLWKTPVYRLLGGPTRERIRVYPSAQAVKIGSASQRQSGTPVELDQLVETVRNTRNQVGPTGAVMFDAHSAIPPAFLIQLASKLEPYDLLFLEEPAVPGNIEVFKRLRQQIRIPLAAGERDRTIWGILPYLTEGVLDVVQPDCGYTGGITQMKKIATLAEAYTTPLAPHCTQSYLGMTASFHVSASIPSLLIHEAYDDDLFGKFLHPHWTKSDGYVTLSDAPGLGIEVDENMLRQLAGDPQYKYKWRGPRTLPDGSVTDY